MPNRALAVLALILSAIGPLYGNWRTDAAERVRSGDYRGASEALAAIYTGLEAADKPEAGLLLAFLFHKQGLPTSERKWLFEFFIGLGETQVDFGYLGASRGGEATAYVNLWRVKYPRLSGVWIVTHKGESAPAAPPALVLGLETQVEMLYKFSGEGGPQRGGVLHRGLNLIPVDARRLFDSSGSHRFSLDLKSGGVEVRQDLAVEVLLSEEPVSSGGPKPMNLEYKVSLFAAGRQIALSRKTGRDKNPLALDIPEVNLRANPMFKPPAVSDDPFDPTNRGVSIMDAIGVVSGLIQDLFKDKKPPYQSAIEKKSAETYFYYVPAAGGGERRIKADVSLKIAGGSLRY